MLTSLQQSQQSGGKEKEDVTGLNCEPVDWWSTATIAASVDVGWIKPGVDVRKPYYDAFKLARDKLINEGWTVASSYSAGVPVGVSVRNRKSYKGKAALMNLLTKDCQASDRSMPASSHDATGVNVNFDTFNLAKDELIQDGWTMTASFDKCSPVSSPVAHDKLSPVAHDKLSPVAHNKLSPVTQRENNNQKRGKLTEEDYYDAGGESDESNVTYAYSEEDEFKSKKYGDEEEDSWEGDEEEDSSEGDEEEDENERKRLAELPTLVDWVHSWKRKSDVKPFAWVNVYAYYNKRKRYGGYGVIVRDLQAKPIAASAKFSADGKSFFTQVLMGIKAGLKLAEANGYVERCIECNSHQVPCLIGQLWSCNCGNDDRSFCKVCEVCFTQTKGCDPSLMPLLREIKDLSNGSPDEFGAPRNWNKAAQYVAKMGKKKSRILRSR